MQLLFQNIQKYVPLSLEEQQLLEQLVIVKKFATKTILQQAGSISSQTYFVLSGVLRSFSGKTIFTNKFYILHVRVGGWLICTVLYPKTQATYLSKF